MIYIASPVDVATGGTELLQQLGYCLKKYKADYAMFYYSSYEGSAVEKSLDIIRILM